MNDHESEESDEDGLEDEDELKNEADYKEPVRNTRAARGWRTGAEMAGDAAAAALATSDNHTALRNLDR